MANKFDTSEYPTNVPDIYMLEIVGIGKEPLAIIRQVLMHLAIHLGF